jgi:hypothetical protein
MASHTVVTGTWRGEYRFDRSERILPGTAVAFIMNVNQGWFGWYRGTVNDDADLGMPGTGIIRGRIKYPHIWFKKLMPICYVFTKDKRRVKLSEFLSEQGCVNEPDYAHPSIKYSGTFSEPTTAEGIWEISATSIRLRRGQLVRMPRLTGKWYCERATD